MQFRLLFHLSLIVLVLSNVSFRWPLNNGKITSTFGESRWDHFHDGVDMISSDEKIYPVEAGQLLYFWNRSLFPLESYPGAGNYKILKHNNGIYSIYMHMTDEISLRKIYTKNDPLGFIGNTGHSFSKHIHFTIADANKNITVNPFGKLPVYADKKKPEIKNVYLKISGKYIMLKNRAKIRLTRHYPVLIKINDSITGKERLGIYKLKAVFNNREILKSDFSKIKFSAQGSKINENKFDSLYDSRGFYKIKGVKYIEGKNVLKITVYDFAGNKSEKVFIFDVKLDMS